MLVWNSGCVLAIFTPYLGVSPTKTGIYLFIIIIAKKKKD